jgi:hypothetical protein
VILSGELCRDQCGEDAVWPAVSLVLKADTLSFPTLFVGGQPTPACKVAMAAGARRLGLRNLIDRYGAQEYFDTLKLQFGFTLQGARKRSGRGGWSGPRAIPCEPENAKAKPNLRPKMLFISSDEGKPIAEINLFDEGLGDPFLLFDLKNGSAVDLASRLDVQKDYALLCESDLTVTGVDHCLILNERRVYRLKCPWPPDLKVLCEGAIYWQPKIAEVLPDLPLRSSLASPDGVVRRSKRPRQSSSMAFQKMQEL